MTVNNSILKTLDKKISIVLSSTDDKIVYRFFTKIFGKDKVYSLDDTEFLHRPIHLVVCTNKIETIDKSLSMAYYLHVPIVIVDMRPKPDFFAMQKISPPKMTYLQIATSVDIAKSWDIESYHDVINMDTTDVECLNRWETILKQTAFETFNMNSENEDNEEQQHSYNS